MIKTLQGGFKMKIAEGRKAIEENLEILNSYHPFLKVAFYLYHANHYAKTEEYEDYQNELYKLKKEVLFKAYKKYPEIFQISFIERGDRVFYCNKCRNKAYREWRNGYDIAYFFSEWIMMQEPCKKCIVEKDYYSLVEFRIEMPIAKFNFHLPYPQSKAIFNKENLPKIKLNKEEMFVKFGREITSYEASLVPLEEVVQELKAYLNKS